MTPPAIPQATPSTPRTHPQPSTSAAAALRNQPATTSQVELVLPLLELVQLSCCMHSCSFIVLWYHDHCLLDFEVQAYAAAEVVHYAIKGYIFTSVYYMFVSFYICTSEFASSLLRGALWTMSALEGLQCDASWQSNLLVLILLEQLPAGDPCMMHCSCTWFQVHMHLELYLEATMPVCNNDFSIKYFLGSAQPALPICCKLYTVRTEASNMTPSGMDLSFLFPILCCQRQVQQYMYARLQWCQCECNSTHMPGYSVVSASAAVHICQAMA